MYKKTKSQGKLPSREMVVDLMNGEDVTESVLNLFHFYIIKASTITTDAPNGVKEKYLDEDLFQMIQINVMTSLPNLRKNLLHHLDPNHPFFIRI